MDEREALRRLIESKKPRGVRTLAEARRARVNEGEPKSALAHVLGRAARQLAARQRAQAEWDRLAGGGYDCATVVLGVESGVLIVRTDSATVAYDIQRRRGALERALARAVPGVARLRVVVRGSDDGPAEDHD